MNNESFEQFVRGQASTAMAAPPFVHYDADGDCIEFLASNDSFYAERIDSLVTVYYSRDTGEIVGSLIKGVSRFIKEVLARAPGFKIEIRDGRIKLVHLFTARLWSPPADLKGTQSITYQKLREVAERSDAEAEVGELALT